MNNVTKLLLLAASVLITIAVITIAITIFGQGQQMTQTAEQDMQGINAVLSAKKFEAYDGKQVSGSQVINAIRMYAETGQFDVDVKTGAAASAKTYDDSTKYTVTSPTDSEYINPVGKFNSALTVNANGIVTKITFTQVP